MSESDKLIARPQVSLLLTCLGIAAVFALTLFFLIHPLVFLTVTFYLILGYTLIVKSKTGIIFLALSFPLVRNSFAAITGGFYPALFYAVFIAGLLVIIYGNIIGMKIRIPPLMMDKYLLLLTLYTLFSLFFFSPEKAYGMEKFKYYAMNIIQFYLIVLIVRNEEDLEAVFNSILYFGIFFTLFSLVSYLDMEPYFGNELAGRFSSLGMNPIWMARYFSYAILIELYHIMRLLPQWDKHIGKIGLLIFLIMFQLYLAMLTGSRGPIIAMLFALLCLVLFSMRANLRLVHIIGMVIVIVITFSVVISLIPADIAERLLSQDKGGQTTSMIRIFLNLEALLMFWGSKIFGIGFGGFNTIIFKYPHNIITEVMAELGLIGLSLLIAIFGLTLKYLIAVKNKLKELNFYFLLAILITSFVNANLSGHLGSNFFFFFSLSLVYAAKVSTEPQE